MKLTQDELKDNEISVCHSKFWIKIFYITQHHDNIKIRLYFTWNNLNNFQNITKMMAQK